MNSDYEILKELLDVLGPDVPPALYKLLVGADGRGLEQLLEAIECYGAQRENMILSSVRNVRIAWKI